MPAAEVSLFFSYAHSDEKLRDELAKHLKLLERQHVISTWHDRSIAAGSEWNDEIDDHLRRADIILLLISADFLASDYSYEVEVETALARHARGEATVIPVILRPVDWKSSKFGKLQALPRDGKPITTFENQDTAFEQVTLGIRAAIEKLSAPRGDVRGHAKGPELMPVSASSPLVLGIAVDVSGSMQASIKNDRGPEANRLQAVFDSLKSMASAKVNEQQDTDFSDASQMVRVFAYGFGFADRASDFGSLASLASRFLNVSVPSPPSRVYRGGVRDLFQMAGLGDRSILLGELGRRWSELESRLWEQRFDLFGETPMREALAAIRKRFQLEFKAYPGLPRSALLVISDGESTDGSPIEECRSLAGEGTKVIGAYLTSSDIVKPRSLYSDAPPDWPAGAKTLFEMSSVVGEDAMVMELLQSQRWESTASSRLFIQLNESEALNEFVSAVLDTLVVGGRDR